MAQDRSAAWKKAQVDREAYDQLQRAAVTEELEMAWIRPESKPEPLPDENVLYGLREAQRVLVERMRKEMFMLACLWRRRGTPGERRCARELFHVMSKFPVARQDEEE